MRMVGSRLRADAGFTVIELLIASIALAVISAPITAVLVVSQKQATTSRERTAADQLADTQLDSIRTIPYTQVGLTNGNPPGTLAPTTTAALPNGETVTIGTKVSFVSDAIPTAYVTNADYKQIVLTVARASDGAVLAQKTTYMSSTSAPPLSGTGWAQIKRTVADLVTAAPVVGANVNLTGGPNNENRNDTADGSGTVLFPALPSSTASPPPNYVLTPSVSGYSVFPDDLAPMTPEQVGAAPGLNSVATIRVYRPATLTVNVLGPTGAPFSGGATISLDSSRCGLSTLAVPAGQSSVTITSCTYATGKTAPLVPNSPGQQPSFDKYGVTAWSTSGGLWGASTPASVPASYPATMTQTMNVSLSSTSYSTKALKVTVTRSGVADANARVEVTGGPIPGGVYLFSTTDSTGAATFTVPVTSSSSPFTITANELGAAKGTATTSVSTGGPSPATVSVAIS
jgi:Tfp pilus assembly protein PilV